MERTRRLNHLELALQERDYLERMQSAPYYGQIIDMCAPLQSIPHCLTDISEQKGLQALHTHAFPYNQGQYGRKAEEETIYQSCIHKASQRLANADGELISCERQQLD